MKKTGIDWKNLGYGYTQTDVSYISYWKEGGWDEGVLTPETTVTISIGSTALHYGQECFEGLKAQRAKDGGILLFRPDQNAKRLNNSARGILIPEVPEEMFINACLQVVKANQRWVPPYRTGASLYLRPFLFGHGDNLGAKPADEYMFCIYCSPVGPYFKGGLKPIHLCVSNDDRAAPRGTGALKIGGNYAGGLRIRSEAKKAGFDDCLFLDAQTRTYIDELGGANFFGITANRRLVTPQSPSILPSITRRSVMEIADTYLDIPSEERPVPITEIDEFVEAGACGTASIIAPIGSIFYEGTRHTFYGNGQDVGPVTQQLYDTLTAIQCGDHDAPEGWMVEV
ncbi:branched chain amino acid aminotransferase [candidate division KSB3 bacterium]|uniref:Branched-chain-amino-acid aminotransferase n=1 Tax=candidate division KSB3 bacterium TaxID=2044937 RepID=A0A2G6KDT7_9BACT|nr:MAG: branched chain amino acid aminotransferase [candidate division KSB3 bacterium]